MTVTIADDFDMAKIAHSGQCFRARALDRDAWLFVTGEHAVLIRALGADLYDVSCGATEWDAVWRPYFDLDRNYGALRAKHKNRFPFLDTAMDFGRGIRVLRQDPWETLMTFILSQRKSIPAISHGVEAIAARWGRRTVLSGTEISFFPTPPQMTGCCTDDFRELGMGYRSAYMAEAHCAVLSGGLDLGSLASLSDDDLMARLQSLHGVGIKVASCVALYAYGRTAAAPVDVWIRRVIDTHFGGENPFPLFGEDAGLLQQYMFYYMKSQAPPSEKRRWPDRSL